jgi:ribosomal protein L16 Arg81 hydroxylase
MESVLSLETRHSASHEDLSADHLLAPLGLASFLSEYWGKAHLFLHRQDQDYYRNLFTLADIDRCMMTGISKPGVMASFISPPGSDRKRTEGTITPSDLDLAYKRFSEGDTIRIIGVDRLNAPVRELALRIQAALGAKVRVNIYLTPSTSQGFTVHFDYHDAFIIQVSGSKHWLVYEPEYAAPVDLPFARIWNSSPANPGALTLREERVLEAGDLLYIPRGFYHEARTAHEHSLHLTFSLDPVYWITVLQKSLELLCRECPELRQALPPTFPFGTDVAVESLEATFQSLLDLVREHASFEKTARHLLNEELADSPPPPDGHFADLVRLEEVSPETRVERRAGFVPILERRDGEVVLQFGAHHVRGPLALLEALEFVRDHRTFKAMDLPGPITNSSRVVLVRRLLREGLLKIHGH